MKNRIIESLLIAVGILALGLCIYGSAVHITNSDRLVSVKGLSEREVPADRVTWPLRFAETGNDLPSLYDKVNGVNQEIIKFLTANGLAQTDITIAPPSLNDLYQNPYLEKRPDYRYEMLSTITVSSDNVEVVRALISRQGELIRKGIPLNSWGASYTFTKLNEIKPEMIKEATESARQAAEQFANDSKSKVGKIKTASQGQFSISDRDDTTPNIKRVRVVTSVVYDLN